MRSWFFANVTAASGTEASQLLGAIWPCRGTIAVLLRGTLIVAACGFPAAPASAAPAPAPVPDLADLARQFEQAQRRGPASDGPVTRIFISFSLPQVTLQRLAEQASHTGAVLVLRGFDGGSLPLTMRHVAAMLGPYKAAVQIDPVAFRRYAVAVVPTFVLSPTGADSQCALPSCVSPLGFASVAGDVSLDFALERIAAGAPAYRAQAQLMIARLASVEKRGR